MSGFDVELVPDLTGRRGLVGCMLVAFLLTFLITRAVTRAALTLDEFALWLRLEDVYWSTAGRSSVDAVLVALVVGVLLLVGANPFDAQVADGELAIAMTVAANSVAALVAILKGRVVLGVVGVFVPLVALVAALRLARPGSPWARRRYGVGSATLARSVRRFPPGRRTRLDRLVDVFALPPAGVNPTADAGRASPVQPARRAEPGSG